MPDIFATNLSTPPTMGANVHEVGGNRFCCNFDEILANPSINIQIVDAFKTSDSNENSHSSSHLSSTPYINYEVRRRYSEFESLRHALSRLYPTVLVPPIPEKHSIAHYATKQSKAKDDKTIINKRKRMLQTFLVRLKAHPILASEHVLHRFLERDTNWSEVLNSPPLSTLPKNPLQAIIVTAPNSGENGHSPSSNGSNTSASLTTLGKPGPLASLRHPDPHFVVAETFTQQFSNLLSGPLTKSNKSLSKKLIDSSKDLEELGAVYNGFSLSETDKVAEAIEKTGQAVDISFMALADLGNSLEEVLGEPIEEYVKYSQIAQKVLKYRVNKHLQLEHTSDILTTKRNTLDSLEHAELESKRLAAALQRETEARDPYSDDESIYRNDELPITPGSRHRSRANSSVTQNQASQSENIAPMNHQRHTSTDLEEVGFEGVPSLNGQAKVNDPESLTSTGELEQPLANSNGLLEPPGHPYQPPTPPVSNGSGGGGNLLNLLSYTLHGLIDVDPEASRRSAITRTKEQVLALENQIDALGADLTATSAAIQRDLDRFQSQKEKDLVSTLANFANHHVAWCRKNLEAWEEALREAEEIPSFGVQPRNYSLKLGGEATGKDSSTTELNTVDTPVPLSTT